MKNKTNYYHISDIKNKNKILKEGLKANEGMIFLFSEITVADDIAFSQVGITEFSVFEIDPNGINVTPIPDNVAEFSAKFQWIVKQNLIEAKHIKHISDREHNVFDLAEEQSRKIAKKLKLDEVSFVESNVVINLQWINHYNAKYGKNLKM
jgi:hypothetical protein